MKNNLKIHFIGIGGISMSALAKFFITLGFIVSGSDNQSSQIINELIEKGVKIYKEHNFKNLEIVDIVVYNNAIKKDNPELEYALKNSLVFSRGELLREISNNFNCCIGIAGCHGKTTASCMISNTLKDKYKIFSHLGGEDKNLGNYYFDGNEVMISEVCEYAKNINLFNSSVAVCLNIGFDHHDCYKNYSELISSYYNFLDRADTKIVNNDDIYLSEYKSINKITYGINRTADFMAKNIVIKQNKIKFDLYNYAEKICTFEIEGICKHNVYNALATICAGKVMGQSYGEIKNKLKEFKGVCRRMEKLAEISGKEFFADYAHHPEEIGSTLHSFNDIYGKKNTLIIFQPHTFSRTKSLFNDFIKVLKNNNLILYKTYPARETEDMGYSAKYLSQFVKCEYAETQEQLFNLIKKSHKKRVLFMGAGDIYLIGKKIIKSLC